MVPGTWAKSASMSRRAAGLTVRDRRPCCHARHYHADPWHCDHEAALGKVRVSMPSRRLGDPEPLRKLGLRGDDVTRQPGAVAYLAFKNRRNLTVAGHSRHIVQFGHVMNLATLVH